MRLVKSSRTTYLPGSPGVPADPGQPYQPARSVQTIQTVCGYGVNDAALMAAGYKKTFVPATNDSAGYFVWTPPNGGTLVGIQYTYACRQESVSTFIPAQPYRAPTGARPATPSQVIVANILGWNARGHSKSSFGYFGEVSFKVPPSSLGVVAGLNNTIFDSGYADILFAFSFSKGTVTVMERGAVVYNYGAYDEGDVFKIKRFNGNIYYEVNDVQIHTSPNTDTPLFLDAALYSSGDSVDDAEVISYSGAFLSLKPLQVNGSEDVIGGAQVIFAPLTVSGRQGVRGTLVMEPIACLGADRIYGSSELSFAPMTVTGEIGLIAPGYAIGEGIVSYLTMSASGLTGEIGGANLRFSPIDGLASQGPYGEASMSFAPMQLFGNGTEGNDNASMYEIMSATDSITSPTELFVVMNSGGTVTNVFAATTTLPADMVSIANVISTQSVQAVLNALMYSALSGASLTPADDDAREVWVVNAETTASTRYENYAFNSFAMIGAVYYGAKSDGIYRLDGDTDEGDPIKSMVSFGVKDFSSNSLKHVKNCYLGMSSSGKVFLKVLYEGNAYVYEARDSSPHLQTQRIDLGRGIRTNYIEFELYNKDGDDFELDTVEFVMMELKRKI